MAGLFEELKRRNVIRVGAAYVVVAWLILQFTDLVLENIAAPDWIMQIIMLIIAIGLPIALIFAWAFEITPEGVKRESQVDRTQSITHQTGRNLDRIIIGVLAMTVVLLAVDRFILSDSPGQNIVANVNKSIAVLPFADLSQNQDQEWFADGLAEEILNALTRTPDLLVSSRTSAFAYKNSNKDIPTIARELSVAHILEGSVRRAGDRLRVTAQLIRASDGFHLWSQNYDRNEEDVIEIQEDLAIKIATALETTMDPDALADMLKIGTHSVEAYQEYIHGIAIESEGFVTGNSDLLLDALAHYERARSIDPEFSSAYLKIAGFWKIQLTPSDTFSELTVHSNEERLGQFQSAIDLAIETAPNPIDRDSRAAMKAIVELRLREASRLLERYLEERPNDFDAWWDYLHVNTLLSEPEGRSRGLDYMHTTGETNFDAASTYINSAFRVIGPSTVADYGLAALERWPDHSDILYQTHRVLLWAYRFDEARELMQRYEQTYGTDPMLSSRHACVEDRRDEVLRILSEFNGDDHGNLSTRWLIQLLLGEPEKATEELRYYETDGIPYQIASFLVYHNFDPTPFPSVMNLLKRENIDRPPPVKMTFGCPAD